MAIQLQFSGGFTFYSLAQAEPSLQLPRLDWRLALLSHKHFSHPAVIMPFLIEEIAVDEVAQLRAQIGSDLVFI